MERPLPPPEAVLIVAVLLLHESAGGTGGVVAIVASAVVGAGFAFLALRPVLRAGAPRARVPAGAMRFGILQATGAALVQFSHRGGVLAVALLAGSAAETGYAALATGIALGVTYAVLQTFTVSLPHLAGADDGRDPEAVLRRLAGGLLAVLGPAVAIAAVLLDVLVPLVFGDRYQSATAAFGPALALVVLTPVSSITLQAAALRFRPEVAAAAGAASAAAFVATALVAVPAWGAVGGTAAMLAGSIAGLATSMRLLPGAVGGLLAGASAGAVVLVLVAAGVG